MAEHRLSTSPAPVAAPIVKHAAVEPPPNLEEPPAVDPVLAPPPALVLAADPAPAVETMEEVIFLVILLVLSQVYPLSVALVPTFVSGSFIFSFSVALLWVYFGKPVYSFLFWNYCFMFSIVLGLLFRRVFCIPLWPSVSIFSSRNLGFLVLFWLALFECCFVSQCG